jgi:hypothetical protein
VAQLRLNGEPVPALLPLSALPQGRTHRIEVSFAAPVAGDARITHAPTVDPLDRTDPRVVAPDVPQQLRLLREPAGVRLQFTPPRHRGTLRYDIVRDGQRIASGLDAPQWLDTTARPGLAHTYAVQAVDVAHGHRSHLSEPARLEDGGALQRAAPDGWFTRTQPGRVGLELLYANTTHETQTGVTNAVKWLRVLDEQGREVAAGVVQMPHQDETAPPRTGLSTLLRVQLLSGRYRLLLQDYFNMSALQSNASYSGAGGLGGPLNHAEVKAVKVIALPDGG